MALLCQGAVTKRFVIPGGMRVTGSHPVTVTIDFKGTITPTQAMSIDSIPLGERLAFVQVTTQLSGMREAGVYSKSYLVWLQEDSEIMFAGGDDIHIEESRNVIAVQWQPKYDMMLARVQ